ncbi:aspartate carbamoyltransferase [SAR86 cluster bacterium]|nr:aspartate carbamoyltransferase [SAR86 cluster bacterium]
MEFLGSNILSIDQFDRKDIDLVFKTADSLFPFASRQKITRVLQGAILSNMFFEPSTRTRISFGSAFNMLGGEVRETTEVEATSLSKGESLYDTSRVLSGYSDVIVMRHPDVGSVAEFAEASRVPVINGGDGDNEHPSQALLDLFTIQKELESHKKDISSARIALIGDLKYGRAVHSLCKILMLYENVSIKLVSPSKLKLPEFLVSELQKKSISFIETSDIKEGISDVDILYMTRIQEERFDSSSEANKYKGLMSLNQDIYTKNCEPNTVIMHPLPRDSRADANELDDDLNQNPNLAIYRQTDNGLLIRMALFALILGVSDKIHETSSSVNWFSNKS